MDAKQSDGLTIGSIRWSEDRIEEMQDGRAFNPVRCADIRSIHLRHGFLARHLVLQLMFGILLTVSSGTVTAGVLRGFIPGAGIVAGAFVFLGLWVVHDGMRRGHYLETWTDRGRRKMAVGSRLTLDQLAQLESSIAGMNAGKSPH